MHKSSVQVCVYTLGLRSSMLKLLSCTPMLTMIDVPNFITSPFLNHGPDQTAVDINSLSIEVLVVVFIDTHSEKSYIDPSPYLRSHK